MKFDDFFNKQNVFAVVGVSRNRDKYGYKVFIDLKKSGYEVYAINPKIDQIEDFKVYSSLKSLPVVPEVIVCIVPPEVTYEVVKEAKQLNINKIWMQPGSESKDAMDFCKKNNFEIIANSCIINNRKLGKLG